MDTPARKYLVELRGPGWIVELEKDPIEITTTGNVSDGYHTMEELYMHRYHLYLALVKVLDTYVTPLSSNIVCWKSKLHDDGTMFEDSFILGMTVTKPSFIEGGDSEDFYITYHLPMKYWNITNVLELKKAPPYDGHTPAMVLERLLRL